MGLIRVSWIDGTAQSFKLSDPELENLKKLNFKILTDYESIAFNNNKCIIRTAQVRCIEIL